MSADEGDTTRVGWGPGVWVGDVESGLGMWSLGWGSRVCRWYSAEQEERQAILQVFTEKQEKNIALMWNFKYFVKWTKCGAAMQLDSPWHLLILVY